MDNALHRFGEAEFASAEDIAAAGYFRQTPDSVFVGFVDGRPLYYSGQGGILTEAGARSGKLRDVIGYNLPSGACDHNMLILDMKGELAAISRDPGKRRYYINPDYLHGLPCHRVNPLDYLRIDSPTLVSDAKVFCLNAIALSGSANASYFEQRARGEFLEGIVLTAVRMNGVLTFPDLYRAINLIPAGGRAWLDFAFEMQDSGFEISARVEEEIANARKDSSGGCQGILGELFKGFSCLSDPRLMACVSPPYDFSYAEFCHGKGNVIYMMNPARNAETRALVTKSHMVAAMIYKERAPQSPRQTWILDECGQLGGFPLVTQLFSYGAGIGIRPWAIVQSRSQLSLLGPKAENIIASSAALQQYFAIRDPQSAQTLSVSLGPQTLLYDDELQQSRARHAGHQALNRMFDGDDPFGAMIDYAHHARVAEMQTKQHRLLRTPAEILSMPPDKQIIFADGVAHPIYADRKPYYEQRSMAGRFRPNPFYPPLDRVRVKTLLGHASLRVIEEPVPPQYAHLPQFSDGRWTRIEEKKW